MGRQQIAVNFSVFISSSHRGIGKVFFLAHFHILSSFSPFISGQTPSFSLPLWIIAAPLCVFVTHPHCYSTSVLNMLQWVYCSTDHAAVTADVTCQVTWDCRCCKQ